MGHIVIISKEQPFREALADAISRELACSALVMDDAAALVQMPENEIEALVATHVLPGPWNSRALVYNPGTPRRLSSILADITAEMGRKTPAMQWLSEDIFLESKNRRIERAGTGNGVELTEKEQALLLYIKEKGEAHREDILRNVWGMAPDADTHTLETHLYRLRQKWREIADFDCILATDKGYRWYDYAA